MERAAPAPEHDPVRPSRGGQSNSTAPQGATLARQLSRQAEPQLPAAPLSAAAPLDAHTTALAQVLSALKAAQPSGSTPDLAPRAAALAPSAVRGPSQQLEALFGAADMPEAAELTATVPPQHPAAGISFLQRVLSAAGGRSSSVAEPVPVVRQDHLASEQADNPWLSRSSSTKTTVVQGVPDASAGNAPCGPSYSAAVVAAEKAACEIRALRRTEEQAQQLDGGSMGQEHAQVSSSSRSASVEQRRSPSSAAGAKQRGSPSSAAGAEQCGSPSSDASVKQGSSPSHGASAERTQQASGAAQGRLDPQASSSAAARPASRGPHGGRPSSMSEGPAAVGASAEKCEAQPHGNRSSPCSLHDDSHAVDLGASSGRRSSSCGTAPSSRRSSQGHVDSLLEELEASVQGDAEQLGGMLSVPLPDSTAEADAEGAGLAMSSSAQLSLLQPEAARTTGSSGTGLLAEEPNASPPAALSTGQHSALLRRLVSHAQHDSIASCDGQQHAAPSVAELLPPHAGSGAPTAADAAAQQRQQQQAAAEAADLAQRLLEQAHNAMQHAASARQADATAAKRSAAAAEAAASEAQACGQAEEDAASAATR